MLRKHSTSRAISHQLYNRKEISELFKWNDTRNGHLCGCLNEMSPVFLSIWLLGLCVLSLFGEGWEVWSCWRKYITGSSFEVAKLQATPDLPLCFLFVMVGDVSLGSQLLLQSPAVCQSAPPSWTYPSGTMGQLCPSFYKMPLSWCFITSPVRLPERPPIGFSHVCFLVCACFVCVQQRGWGAQMFCFCQWRQKLHRQCLRPRQKSNCKLSWCYQVLSNYSQVPVIESWLSSQPLPIYIKTLANCFHKEK